VNALVENAGAILLVFGFVSYFSIDLAIGALGYSPDDLPRWSRTLAIALASRRPRPQRPADLAMRGALDLALVLAGLGIPLLFWLPGRHWDDVTKGAWAAVELGLLAWLWHCSEGVQGESGQLQRAHPTSWRAAFPCAFGFAILVHGFATWSSWAPGDP
jgi:hypothetical protein